MPGEFMRASDLVSLHTIYAYLTGLQLTLIGMKYQGSGSNPFKEHHAIMMLFLMAIFVYVIALITIRSDQIEADSPNLKLVVCHISGTLACELLVLVLVPPIWCFIINVSSLLLVVAFSLCYPYLLRLLRAVEARRSETQQGTEMPDVEAAGTSTP